MDYEEYFYTKFSTLAARERWAIVVHTRANCSFGVARFFLTSTKWWSLSVFS